MEHLAMVGGRRARAGANESPCNGRGNYRPAMGRYSRNSPHLERHTGGRLHRLGGYTNGIFSEVHNDRF